MTSDGDQDALEHGDLHLKVGVLMFINAGTSGLMWVKRIELSRKHLDLVDAGQARMQTMHHYRFICPLHGANMNAQMTTILLTGILATACAAPAADPPGEHMRKMQTQMHRIHASKDPAERKRLMEEHMMEMRTAKEQVPQHDPASHK